MRRSDLRDVTQIFRQRQDDRHLEEACRLGVDDLGAISIEEHTDLLLDGKRDCPKSQHVASHHEPMWVLRQHGFSGKARSWR